VPGSGNIFKLAQPAAVFYSFYRNFAITKKKTMGLNKAEEFSVKDNRIARYARALANPARVAILQLLIKKQACICGDIVEELPLSQSTVSQHLKELKEAGLIKGEISGTRVCYCIDANEWENAKACLHAFFESYAAKGKCC
jgi:DNA-binding transcriptional ArsR family regulator